MLRAHLFRCVAANLGVVLLLACAGAPQIETPRDTGLLVFWEVESAGPSGGRVWLLGSIHAARPELRLDPSVVAAFRASDALVLEVDLADADPLRMRKLVQEYAILGEGQTAADVLPEATWNRLSSFLRTRGMPPEMFQWYEPWFLLSVVTTALFEESGARAGSGVEMQLLGIDTDKEVVALESPEFQLDLLRTLPRSLVVAMIDEMLTDEDAARDAGSQLLDAWEAGDLERIAEVALPETKGDADLQEFQERTFFARNRAMAERLDELLGEPGTWFVAVGAAHMAGDQGIPALLEAEGHSVTRVPRSVLE